MITVSKKTALKLKEAGWVKECKFGYYKIYSIPVINAEVAMDFINDIKAPVPIAQAPTIQEIIDDIIERSGPFDFTVHLEKNHCAFISFISEPRKPEFENNYVEDNLVEALAELYIKLKEEGLI